MPIRGQSAKGLRQLEAEFRQNPAEIKRRQALAMPIGRSILNDDLREILRQMSGSQSSSLAINPVNPLLEYFPLPVVHNMAASGWNSERLNLQPGAPVNKRIYTSHELADAIPHIQGIDVQTIGLPLTVPFVDISTRSHGTQKYGVALQVMDVTSTHYSQGYALQGEKEVLGPVRQRDYRPTPYDPTRPPTHQIYLAEVLSDSKDDEFVNKLRETFCDLLAPAIGAYVELGPIEPTNRELTPSTPS